MYPDLPMEERIDCMVDQMRFGQKVEHLDAPAMNRFDDWKIDLNNLNDDYFEIIKITK